MNQLQHLNQRVSSIVRMFINVDSFCDFDNIACHACFSQSAVLLIHSLYRSVDVTVDGLLIGQT